MTASTREEASLVALRARLERVEREAAARQLQLERYAADLREIFKQERARARELRRSYVATVRALSNAVSLAKLRAARYGWRESFNAGLWWQTCADVGVDPAWYSQRARGLDEVLPWDHVNVKKGREYLEKEQKRSLLQLEVMAGAK